LPFPLVDVLNTAWLLYGGHIGGSSLLMLQQESVGFVTGLLSSRRRTQYLFMLTPLPVCSHGPGPRKGREHGVTVLSQRHACTWAWRGCMLGVETLAIAPNHIEPHQMACHAQCCAGREQATEHTAATSALWSTRIPEEHHASQPADCDHN